MDLYGINKMSVNFINLLLLLFVLLGVYTNGYTQVNDLEAYPFGNFSSFDLEDGAGIGKLLDLNQSLMATASKTEVVPTKCNLFKGSWVQDDAYPLYRDGQCPYVSYKLNCRLNGRPDGGYEKWRWQPNGCSMPRFNAIDMLQRLRGKRLMFIGDSISQSQWESLVCLLYPFIKQETEVVTASKYPIRQFKIPEYKASVEFFWDPLLVELKVKTNGRKVLNLNGIGKYGKRWKNVDILVFETSHWWDHEGNQRSWDQLNVGRRTFNSDNNPMKAYRKALNTWSKWISKNLDPRKNVVFFRTMSLKHLDLGPDRQNCYNQVAPEKRKSYLPPVAPQVSIVRRVIKRIKYPVHLLDISRLAAYRIDGHPSLYSRLVKGNEKRDPQINSDCSHWCLPGVPDTWNELLYASLVMN